MFTCGPVLSATVVSGTFAGFGALTTISVGHALTGMRDLYAIESNLIIVSPGKKDATKVARFAVSYLVAECGNGSRCAGIGSLSSFHSY